MISIHITTNHATHSFVARLSLSGLNRMRGYYITKNKLEGYKDGSMYSYYFVPEERVKEMRQYIPVR